MDKYIEEMKLLADTIASGDGQRLLEIFGRAKAARDRYIDTASDPGSTE